MELYEWYYSVSPNELKQIADNAGTTPQYLRMIKSDWSNPSISLQMRIIEAARLITPNRVPDFTGWALKPGRKTQVTASMVNKIVEDYKVSKLTIKAICDKHKIAETTLTRYLKMSGVQRDRIHNKRMAYGKS